LLGLKETLKFAERRIVLTKGNDRLAPAIAGALVCLSLSLKIWDSELPSHSIFLASLCAFFAAFFYTKSFSIFLFNSISKLPIPWFLILTKVFLGSICVVGLNVFIDANIEDSRLQLFPSPGSMLWGVLKFTFSFMVFLVFLRFAAPSNWRKE